jgi:hypothetical protein
MLAFVYDVRTRLIKPVKRIYANVQALQLAA